MPCLHPRGLAAAAIVTVVALACADQPQRTHQITYDDYFTLTVLTAPVVSPDGKSIIYNDMRWNPPEDKRNNDLWVVGVDGNDLRRLTFDPANDHDATFTPDGKTIYFLSNRKRAGENDPPWNGKTQVWRMALAGGEATAVTTIADGVSGFALTKDGKTLYYSVDGEADDGPFAKVRKQFPKLEYGLDKRATTTIHVLDLTTWRSREVVSPDRYVREFAVSPTGQRIAMITDPDDRLVTHEGQSRVEVYDVRAEKLTTLPEAAYRDEAPNPHGWLDTLAWADDGAALAWQVSFDGYPTEVIVATWDGGTAQVRALDRPAELFVTGNLHWRSGSRDLCLTADVRAISRIYAVRGVDGGDETGDWQPLSPADQVVKGYAFGPDGKLLVAIMSNRENVGDLFKLKLAGQPAIAAQLTDANPQVATWKLPQIQRFTWTGANGDEVEGILELPPGYQQGDGPLPTLIELHGGPTSATMFELRFWIYGRTLYAANGYALLSPNYRGSTGYGDEFLVDLIGHENDIDVRDIKTGVDALVAAGIADPQQLGVMGWSNGGFLTNAMITSDERFAAASSGAGVIDQLMQWGLEDTPGHVINYMQGLPWEQAEAYLKGSPVFKLGNVRAATLIHVGGNDNRVPAAHSRTLFRALRDYRQVPTQLVVYPGEGHGLSTYTHRRAKMAWDWAWFDQYLRGKDSESPASEGGAGDAPEAVMMR